MSGPCKICRGGHDQWTCPERETFELKACAKCGAVRRVKVTRSWVPKQADGSGNYLYISYNERCTACEHEWRAGDYERRAREHRVKAAEWRRNRRMRKQAKES